MNTPLSPIDRSSREKINKETSELIHTLDQMDTETKKPQIFQPILSKRPMSEASPFPNSNYTAEP
jgi:hypothetical protein